MTLLDKPDCRKVSISPKYRGFRIPDELAGYGLDSTSLPPPPVYRRPESVVRV